jgi:hypothetical protein
MISLVGLVAACNGIGEIKMEEKQQQEEEEEEGLVIEEGSSRTSP